MSFSTFKEHNPPPLPVGKRSEEEKSSADKLFPGAAKDSSEQVGFGDGSFCNSEHDFFPTFIKTTQLSIFSPSNQGTVYGQAHLWEELSCLSHQRPVNFCLYLSRAIKEPLLLPVAL